MELYIHDNIRVVWYRIEAEKFALPRYGCFILILSLLEPRLEALESYLRDCSFDSPSPPLKVGAFHVLQSCDKAMAKQGGSGYAIVQTGSVAGLRGTPTMAAYVSSKVPGVKK